jgi:hypothetical protein
MNKLTAMWLLGMLDALKSTGEGSSVARGELSGTAWPADRSPMELAEKLLKYLNILPARERMAPIFLAIPESQQSGRENLNATLLRAWRSPVNVRLAQRSRRFIDFVRIEIRISTLPPTLYNGHQVLTKSSQRRHRIGPILSRP